MAHPRALDLIADEVRSEAKRLGTDSTDEALVLLVLVKRFGSELGENAVTQAQVEEYIKAGSTNTGRTAEQVLNEAAKQGNDYVKNVAALLSELQEKIRRSSASGDSEDGHQLARSSTSSNDLAGEAEDIGAGVPADSLETSGEQLHLPDVSLSSTQLSAIRSIHASLRRANPLPVVLHGRPGAGRSSVLGALARGGAVPDRGVLVVDTQAVLATPSLFRTALKAGQAGDVVIIDDCDVLLGLGTPAPNGQLVALVTSLLSTPRVAVVLSVPTPALSSLEVLLGRIVERAVPVEVSPLHGTELADVVSRAADSLTVHHGIGLDGSLLTIACAAPPPGSDRAHPGLAIDRLDVAATNARISGSDVASEEHLGEVADAQVGESIAQLDSRLRQWVVGQDHAIERLSKRLILTRAQLDLRPERPDGVFLFVGPSGVGKTALAKALALELFGNENRLIRLDMSEYAETWSISRLIGPQPGYVGSTEPQSWLTTRVRNAPRSVILLDEVEKAHPEVWNVFLQVFDAGHLTDSRGEIADFSRSVILLTSNLGTGRPESKSIGFVHSADKSAASDARVLEVVSQYFRPELLNRLDETLVFRPLTRDSLYEVARKEVRRFEAALAERGLRVQVSEAAILRLANDGYDERFGARHLQRSLERHILEELAVRGRGGWAVDADDAGFQWTDLRVNPPATS